MASLPPKSLPPKIDQRSSEDIALKIEALAEDFTKDIEGGRWKPPGAIEAEVAPEKPELLSGLILNQNIAITVQKPTVANLTDQILNEDIDLGDQKIIKKGTLLNDEQAQEIVEKKESVEVLKTRNTLIDATLAQQISEVEELGQVKVKVRPPAVIEVERKYWIAQTLAEDIGNIKSGTVINEDIAQEIEQQGRSKVKVKVETDAGQALIRIFGKMVKLVSDRLNQVPEKNFLAFLDLIGGQLQPPQPAKVPLTFHLAEGSPVDGLVPAHTQVSAPPAEGSEEEIVFETDRELVVTTAQLQAVFVREPSRDMYSDRTLEATGQKDEAFFAFAGYDDIEHSLYISCPEIFSLSLPELENLNLIITGDTQKFQSLQENQKLDWFYWDGSQWKKVENPSYENNKLTFSDLPIPADSEIHGKTAKWLQAKLTNIDSNISVNLPQEVTEIQGSIEITQSDLIPEVCLFNNTPLDLSKDFYPFGEQPQLNDTFYIALHDPYIKPNATITLDINLTNKPKDIDNLEITWEIGNGQIWQKIEIAVSEDEKVSWIDEYDLHLIPIIIDQKITVENYADTLPKKGKSLVILAQIKEKDDLFYHARIFNRNEKKVIDKGKDEFAPDKTLEPELNEAFESQPIDDLTKSKLIQKITSSLGYTLLDFTESEQEATLKFPNLENMPSPSTVNGETRYWIRARITQGHYGQPSKKRNYAIYNEVATVNGSSEKDNKTIIDIVGNAEDLFSQNDVIRFVWIKNSKEEREEYEIDGISENKLTLKEKVTTTEAKAKGTKIFRRYTISETTSPTYDPPLVKSLKLTYNFTLEENAIYFANNDLIYSHPDGDFLPFTPTVDEDPTLYLGFDKSFDNKTVTLYAQVEPPSPDELSTDITLETVLTEAANVGKTTLKLADITGWRPGDRIQIKTNENQGDVYIITNIDEQNEVTISPPLQLESNDKTKVIRPTTQPKLVAEYSSSQGWQPLGVQDGTQAFSQRGLIQFIAPADFSQIETFGQQLYWLRVRWEAGNFRVKPRLRRILTNTIWAIQATTLKEEVLGSSNSDPNQVFVANHTPILMGQQLEVQEGQIPLELEAEHVKVIRDNLGEIEEVWVLWQEVGDFQGSSASDSPSETLRERHYTLDRQTGEIRFGDGLSGMIPPRGRNNIRLSFYRTGGGTQGNITSHTISQLKTTIPYIDRVINHEPSAGGGEQETLAHLKQRVPKQLRHRDRAVTHDDFVDLAYEASTDVARVKVVTPDSLTTHFSPFNEDFWLDPNQPNISFNDILKNKQWETINEEEKAHDREILEEIKRRAGQVKLIILPQSSDRQPVPSLALLEQVETYIRARCQPTMDLVVTGPKWQEVTLETTIVPISRENADLLKDQVKDALETFLHPLTGGRMKKGWQFGRHPHASDFYAIIHSISGVNLVDSLKVLVDSKEVFSSEKSESENTLINDLSLIADTLIYSGNHIVELRQ